MGEAAAVSGDSFAATSGGPDGHLRWLLARLSGPELAAVAEAALEDAWAAARGPIADLHASLAGTPPRLDAEGGVTAAPAARELEQRARRLGLVGSSYQPGWRGLSRRAPRALTGAVLLALAEVDRAAAGGSLLVTDAVCRTLERHDPALAARWLPRLTGTAEPAATGAILLTEDASGADLGRVETVAARDGDGGWRLCGEKSWAANAGAELALVLARPERAAGGTRDLGLFAVPRRLDDGSPNALRVVSLRDQGGIAGLALGAVRLEGAHGWPVGRPGRGFRQAMDLVTVMRVLLGVVAGAITRRAAELAGAGAGTGDDRDLGARPLYREQLAELVVDAAAATAGALVGADLLQRADHGRLGNDGSVRLLAPLLKRALSGLASGAALRALRMAGDSRVAAERALVDDALAVGAWEGSPDLLALEIVRAADQGHATALFADLEGRLAAAGPAAPLAGRLEEELAHQRAELEELALLEEPMQQVRAAQISDRLTLLTLASFLLEQGRACAEETASGRLLWVAARFTARLAGEAARAAVTRDARWLASAPALLGDRRPAPLEIGLQAAQAVASAWR